LNSRLLGAKYNRMAEATKTMLNSTKLPLIPLFKKPANTIFLFINYCYFCSVNLQIKKI